ncbi:MAG: ACT domain-containing protein [Bacteroidales bacterium]|jgi:hypothetical protein|nr:ACT domain-containing protein [Bacteroidales bacterium]
MIIKQVSVRIEDRVGSTWQVFQTLADNRINILSYSIEDTPPQGTLRLIVDDSTKADEVLRNVGFITQLTNVYSMNVPNHVGSMSRVLKYLTENEVSIDFMYVFQYMGISQTVLHSRNMKQLEQVLTRYEQEQLNLTSK